MRWLGAWSDLGGRNVAAQDSIPKRDKRLSQPFDHTEDIVLTVHASPPVSPDRYVGCVPALVPYAAALEAFHAGEADTVLRLRSSLGEDERFPLEFFFRSPAEMMSFELYALDLCRGRVLDLGAGVGPHSLALQERGHSVVAVEISRRLVALLRQRGVDTAVCADFRFWSAPGFDTVLMLMNGLGPTATLAGLDRFLDHAPRFLAPGGQMLVDAAEVVPAGRQTNELWPPAGDYAGQAWIELAHAGQVGRPFRELYVDVETLGRRAVAAGWRFDVAFEGEDGAYVARLTRS